MGGTPSVAGWSPFRTANRVDCFGGEQLAVTKLPQQLLELAVLAAIEEPIIS
jgi:hypothetical protein